TAHHDQVFGQPLEVENLHVSHRLRLGESWHFGNRRAGTEIEEDAVAANGPCATAVDVDFNRAWSDESGVAHDQFRAARDRMVDVHLMKPLNHQPLAPLHALHVDAQRFGFEAEFRASPGKGNDLGGIDDVLAWKAGNVRAGAAEQPSLNHRG